jgi:hypothetical protein
MLAPVIAMKRFLTLLVALLAFGTLAFATSLPANGSVTVTNDQGQVVGSGSIVNGQLKLNLDTNTSGFVTITITNTATNESETYQAMVKNGTVVTVVDGSQFKNLKSFAKDGGVDSVDVTETPDNHASATGQTEKADHATTPAAEDNSQATDHSQGNGQVSGGQQPGSQDGNASSSGSSPDHQSETSSTDTNQTKVGTSLDSHESTDSGSGSSSGSTDTSTSGSSQTDD